MKKKPSEKKRVAKVKPIGANSKADGKLDGRADGKLRVKLDGKADGKLNGKADGHILSGREIEVLQNMANGLSSKRIADKLCISFDTVESHRKSIYKKIDVNTATEAIAFGFRKSIIE